MLRRHSLRPVPKVRRKVWKGDACCPRYDSYIDVFGNLVEINEVRRNVCEELYENYIGELGDKKREEECQCVTDDDCTECEYCEIRTANNIADGGTGGGTQGRCKIDCDLCRLAVQHQSKTRNAPAVKNKAAA